MLLIPLSILVLVKDFIIFIENNINKGILTKIGKKITPKYFLDKLLINLFFKQT